MAKLVVLVRHGKAQSRDLGLPDFERELTGAGRRSLEEWLVKSRKLMGAEQAQTFELWASPAARTMQTAQVVAEVWGKKLQGFPRQATPVDFLWEGDTSGVLGMMRQSSADAIVVCGHNPQIELLCERLTGSSIRFATGGVAGLRMGDDAVEFGARLLWFVQGPISRDWKNRL